MKTVRDVLELLGKMSGHPELSAHAASLMGPRKRGSTTNAGLEALPQDRKLEQELGLPKEVTQDGCRYYYLYAGELRPCMGAIIYDSAVSHVGKDNIKVRQGAHGPELFIDCEQGTIPEKETYFVCVIYGPPGEYGFEDGVIYTWHPGWPLATYKGGEPGFYDGVKTHNG